MALHPVIQQALSAAADAVPYYQLPLAEARAQALLGYPTRTPPVAVGAVRDTSIPGPAGAIPVRIYTPAGHGPHPITVFFHGSGFVLLGLESHDDICRRLCVGAASLVVSVDYRLAPEHKFPAAPDDCLAAVKWIAQHAGKFEGDAMRIAVAGDSAGACLAAVTALRIRDDGGPVLLGQLLWYPVTDFPSAQNDSYRAFGTGYGLSEVGMRWFWQQYLGEATAAEDDYVSPLRLRTAQGLPPACVLVAEYDVLRDEGEAYARCLDQAGIATLTRRYAGMNHGFLKYTGVLEQADAAMADACNWLAQRFLARQGSQQKGLPC